MSELELYKFINDNNIEWHWDSNDGSRDVIIFPNLYEVADFNRLVKSCTDDEGIECRMRDGYFCFWMQDICDHYGIKIENVFPH